MLKKTARETLQFFLTYIGILDFFENYDKIEGIKMRVSSCLEYLGK